MNNTRKHAEIEFGVAASLETPDNPFVYTEFKNEILALVDAFGNSGQSGGSAPYVANAVAQVVKNLCLQNPIVPVTGSDAEWNQATDNVKQNRRCSALFIDTEQNDTPYYLDAIIWKTPKGFTYSGMAQLPGGEMVSSRQNVTFPFTPKTFYIDVDELEVAPDDWEFFIKDASQLDEVFAYYTKRPVADEPSHIT